MVEGNSQLPPQFYKQGAEDNHQRALKENEQIDSSSHMDHVHPSLRSFFLIDELKLGKAITVSFPRRDFSSSLQFLPKEVANSIPFSLKELPNLLQRLLFSKDTPQATAMEVTLRICEDSPIKGETKYCATSVRGGNARFCARNLGRKNTTNFSEDSNTLLLQNYTILDAPQDVAAP
ncbi:BURP domain-containing protein BNM2A-like [Capsicum chacoense]|uniref:BURP domain-containing protein n=1 Tax=Capsicum annuum TaxID=4072 RepID=A0A2G2ZGL0_CAPAN|nr:BURP domain-containing protein BNM2A-like [Capsicum annuum]KAF3612611.1 putative BURP domain-containing protein 17-like [Capsicum annuum]KAF3667690.1 putative BURP domain-containing protein 17-like [Capsicum annuum]PHT81136.1 hypothetical protein T459_14151 [Capsicum annuum]